MSIVHRRMLIDRTSKLTSPRGSVEICLGQQIVYGLANLDVLWMSPWTCRKYVTTLDIWMCD